MPLLSLLALGFCADGGGRVVDENECGARG